MNLNNLFKSPAWIASGSMGFFGEGYRHHKLLYPLGMTHLGTTFVAKTVTWHPRLNPEKKEGNMRLLEDGITPAEFKPKCIHITPRMWFDGIVLNAVGLSNAGAEKMVEDGRWQKRKTPFQISFMAMGKTPTERLEELLRFLTLIKDAYGSFRTFIALQINYSCPNTGHDIEELIDEVLEGLNTAQRIHVPFELILKFNVQLPIEKAKVIALHPRCAGLCISNTIPFGAFPDKIDWVRYFGTADKTESPLRAFGGGGLSGAPLLPLVVDWISNARRAGITCHINAGGGILRPRDIGMLFNAGANSFSLGTINMLRPWMMFPTILSARRKWIANT